MNNKYILMRHGETKYQAKGLDMIYSEKEYFGLPITKRAKKRIKQTAKIFKKEEIDFIYSSDLYRTKQTAEIMAKELGLKIRFEKRLRDIDFGVFAGGPASEHKKIFSSKMQRFSKRPEKGESWRDVKKRAVSFLREIDKKHKNKTILIVSHADVVWLLAGYIKGLTEKELLKRRKTSPEGIWPDVGQVIIP